MITHAGDLGVTLDTGNNRPGTVQRFDGKAWHDFVIDGEPVRWPVKLERLPPGRYRVRPED